MSPANGIETKDKLQELSLGGAIHGDLTVGGDELTTLTPNPSEGPVNLTQVTGDFIASEASKLQTLGNLENLNRVGGGLAIENNALLTSIGEIATKPTGVED